MVLASNLSVGLRARQTRQGPRRPCELDEKYTMDQHFLVMGSSLSPTSLPANPVPCFLSQRRAFSVLRMKKQPPLPSSKKPTKGTGQDQSSGRKHCYLTRGDVPLYSKVKVASGQKQQQVTS